MAAALELSLCVVFQAMPIHDHVRRDFDPLFYGFDKRSWGTWFQGEVTGGWLLFNNNQRNHLVHLAATPIPM